MRSIYLFLAALLISGTSFALTLGPIHGSTTGCVGSNIMFTDSIGGGTWSSSNDAVATIGSASGVYTGVTLGNATITYTLGGSYITTVVTIAPYIVPSVSISASPSGAVCSGTEVTYTASATNGGSAPAYQWKLNSAAAGGGTSYSAYPASGDTVGVILTSNEACTMPDTAIAYIAPDVLPSLIPIDSIGAIPGFSIGRGETDTLIAFVTGGGTSYLYQWVVNSTIVPGANSYMYITDSLANNDSVSCIVVSVGPCGGDSSFNSVAISVGPSAVATVTQGAGLTLYPNPNNGVFTLQGTVGATGSGNTSIEIMDLTGKVVYSTNAALPNGQINAHLQIGDVVTSGMYFVRLSSAGASVVLPLTVVGE